ncbi:MAG TPA: carbon starvation CstA family protein, partial [Polyangiaceae bacterium]
LLASVYLGRYFHEIPALARTMTFEGETLAYAIIVYGLLASALPVWLLLAPRDYLSTFMKLGTIAALAIGILVVMPNMALPAVTRFIDGTGPVFAGSVFPFLFVTIACGAISGFHSLIASGTTPKLITRESHARSIGYGSMLLESAVAIMALIAAGTLNPGVYFAINSPAAIVGVNPSSAVDTITGWGFPVTAETMALLAKDLGESSMFGRAGGAPTLAVGMAEIFSRALGGRSLLSLWYHFAIMFEALFILTTIDAGTRVGRFLLQAFLKHWYAPLGNTSAWGSNIVSSVLLVAAWGYFLVQGVLDPLGGINTLWPLFGIANQLLSVIALCLATTILLKLGYRWQTLLTLLPLTWVSAVTFTASFEKLFSSNPKIGFLSAARALSVKLGAGNLSPAALNDLKRGIFNLYVDATVAGFFLVLVGAVVCVSVARWRTVLAGAQPVPSSETTPIWLSDAQLIEPEQHGRARVLKGALLLFLGLFPGCGHRSSSIANRTAGRVTCLEPNDAGAKGRATRGKAWANDEARRFERPRCC